MTFFIQLKCFEFQICLFLHQYQTFLVMCLQVKTATYSSLQRASVKLCPISTNGCLECSPRPSDERQCEQMPYWKCVLTTVWNLGFATDTSNAFQLVSGLFAFHFVSLLAELQEIYRARSRMFLVPYLSQTPIVFECSSGVSRDTPICTSIPRLVLFDG